MPAPDRIDALVFSLNPVWREKPRLDFSSIQLDDGHNLEGSQDPVVLKDRDILTRLEDVLAHAIAGFIGLFIAMNVIMERPFATALSNDMATSSGSPSQKRLTRQRSLDLRQSASRIRPSSSSGAIKS